MKVGAAVEEAPTRSRDDLDSEASINIILFTMESMPRRSNTTPAPAGHHLWQLVQERADQSPESVFAIDEQGHQLTFGGLRDAAFTLATRLHLEGIRGGDVVSWQMPTWIRTAVLTVALDRIGVTQNPLLPSLRHRDLEFITTQLRSTWLLTPTSWHGFDHRGLAADVARTNGQLCVALVDRDEIDPPADVDIPPRHDVDTHWVFYTSGTTGHPKGVRHGHATVEAATRSMVDRIEVDTHDRAVIAFSSAHIGGINWLMASLLSGCSLLLIESFGDPSTMDIIERSGVTLLGVTTAFHLAYLAAQRATPDRRRFPAVRAYPGGAAAKPPGLHHDLVREVGGVGIVSGYGLTESPMNAMSSVRDPGAKLAGTEGRPSDGVDVRVIDADGLPVPPGVDGELRVRGAHLFQGYVDPMLAVDAFDEDGYFRTGDLGHLDADGYVVVTGRLKDVIVRKGINISARELEDLLFDHTAIADVTVIGLPDPARGERVCAVVVPHDGTSAPDLAQISRFLHDEGVMVQKHPEQLEVLESLPRNAGGKVRKDQLRKTFGQPPP